MVAHGGIAGNIAEPGNAFPFAQIARVVQNALCHLIRGGSGGHALEFADVFDQLHVIVVAQRAFAHLRIARKFVVVQVDEVTRNAAVALRLLLRHPFVPAGDEHVVHVALARLFDRVVPLLLEVAAPGDAVFAVGAVAVVVARGPAPPVHGVVLIRLQHGVAERAAHVLGDGNGHDAVVAVLLALAVLDALPAHPGEPVVLVLVIPDAVRRGGLVRPLRLFDVERVAHGGVQRAHVAADDPRLSFRVLIPLQAVRGAVPKGVVRRDGVIIVV